MRHLCLLLLLSAALPAQLSLKLAPVADATTNADQPTTNQGTAAELSFGKDFTSTPSFRVWFTRGHVRFDLSTITRPAPVRATFWWYQTRSNAAGCLNVATHRVIQAWSESTVTWATNPAFDPTAVSKTCVGDSFALGWKQFDVTPLVRGWLTNQYPNFGFVIRDDGEITAGAARPGYGASREATDPSRQPYLELSWFVNYGTGCAVTTPPSLTVASGTPSLGSLFVLAANGMQAAAPTILLLGNSDKVWGSVPLPYTLVIPAPTNCRILASGEAIFAGAAGGNGTALFPLAIPNNPVLRGVQLYHQAASLDVQQQLSLTNAGAEVIW